MALDPEQIQQIEEMHKKGMNITKIAKALNIARDTVYKYLQEHYPEQYKKEKGAEMQSQTQQAVQPQPAVSPIQKELVENAPEKEGDMLAKILSKYNLSQPLTTEEVNFLIGTLKKKYLSLDKVLQEELRQGAENEARKAFLAKISEIIDDALSLGIEMHYIAKDFEDFCKKKGMTFPEFVRVAGTQYITGQAQYEEAPSETITKVLEKVIQVNATRQLNTILLAKILMGE
jgi:transposase